MNMNIGTCSWNYSSWKDLVYSSSRSTAAEYLSEYSEYFSTAEIDSWFYKLPARGEVDSYLAYAANSLRFTAKITNSISLTHYRQKNRNEPLQDNPHFLSNEVFEDYLHAADPMLPRIDALMLEFEYLNRQKMPSQEVFMRKLGDFSGCVPADVPLAVECRNGNYMNAEYFQFLQQQNLIHVFSEKIYMPHIYELYEKFADMLGSSVVIRLLGGDRKAIEKRTKKNWNEIVEPKKDLEQIINMTKDLISRGKRVTINVNNHYEGSAPLTIRRIRQMLE